MKVLKFLFALWAILIFFITLILVTPCYAIVYLKKGREADETAHHYLSRTWARTLLILYGIRLKVHGREKLKPGQAYIFVSNHRSMLDIPVAACSTTHYFKFLAKAELGKVPLLGFVISRIYILVDRGSRLGRARSMIRMREDLKAGISVLIYPEGTRNNSDNFLGSFHDGAFQLALDTKMPIAVLTVMDTGKLLPAGEFFQLRPGRVDAYWDIPMAITEYETLGVQGIKARVIEAMSSHKNFL